jgi:predicted MFS family arabinose efflux permease
MSVQNGHIRLRSTDPLSRLYAFGATWMGVMVMPVLVPFLASRGISASEVFDLQAIYACAMLICEVPTGIICDWLGRKATLLVASSINIIGFIVFAVAYGFWAYVGAHIILATAFTLVSGADVALLYDILDEDGAHRSLGGRAWGDRVRIVRNNAELTLITNGRLSIGITQAAM